MNMIRPIETEYNGYRFRSRLEARWAVFFDTLGIPYEYEPEGFELGDGVRYLPDFWLPTWGAWVEIKPEMDQEDKEHALALLQSLAEVTDADGLLLSGEVWPGRTDILLVRPEGYWTRYTRIAECRRCDGICFLKTLEDGEADGTGETGWCDVGPHTCGDHERWPLDDVPRILAAYKAARQVRFEFGEQRKGYRRRQGG